MPANSSSIFTSAAGFVSGFEGIIIGMQQVADQIMPMFLCIAFVLLVFGTMRGFMQTETRHFFGNLLRTIVLVALIGNWQGVAGIVTNAASVFCNLQITANFGLLGNGPTTTTARLDITQLATTIQQKAAANVSMTVTSQSPAAAQPRATPPTMAQSQTGPAQSQGWWQQAMQTVLNGMGTVANGAANMTTGIAGFVSNPATQTEQTVRGVFQDHFLSPLTHCLCEVLYAIFLLALLLCELIVLLMELLQQCILVFLGLYVPVGFAEFSIPSLRGQAQAFFKAYLGVQCWPIGWVFVNIVTLALFKNMVSPNPENVGQLLWAIVICVPVFLWVVIGHILAPFYAQKLVTRGGAELQAFTGAMIATVGGTSGSFYGDALALGRKGVNWLDRRAKPKRNGNSKRASGSQTFGDAVDQWTGSTDINESSDRGLGAGDLLGPLIPGLNEVKRSETKRGLEAAGNKARALGFWGIKKAIDLGEFGTRTASNLASTVGALVSDASSHRIGPESGFAFPRIRRNTRNRSSQRATDYLNYQDPEN
jgi:hypothetical protein